MQWHGWCAYEAGPAPESNSTCAQQDADITFSGAPRDGMGGLLGLSFSPSVLFCIHSICHSYVLAQAPVTGDAEASL